MNDTEKHSDTDHKLSLGYSIDNAITSGATSEAQIDLGGRYSFQRMFGRIDNTSFFAEALAKYGSDGSIDPEVERKLVQKLDWIILPWYARQRSILKFYDSIFSSSLRTYKFSG